MTWTGSLTDALAAAVAAVEAAPYQPSPPLCRECPCVRGRRCLLDDALEGDR